MLLRTVGQGQEFVLDAEQYPGVIPWVRAFVTKPVLGGSEDDGRGPSATPRILLPVGGASPVVSPEGPKR